MEKIAEGLVWYAVFLFSLVFHEAAHAFTALKLGDRSAYDVGQVSMNPVPHVRREPVGTIIIPVLSFLLGGWMIGWASAPYDPYWALRYPKRSAMMALAGPSANFILVIVMFIFMRVGVGLNIFLPPESINFSHLTDANGVGVLAGLAKFVSIAFSLNLLLCFFNLLPLPPLDGSGVVPLLLDEGTARKYIDFISNPSFMFIGLLIAWKLFDVIFDPIFLLAINLLYPGVSYH